MPIGLNRRRSPTRGMFLEPAAEDARGVTDTTTTHVLQERIHAARALHAAGQAGDFDAVLAAYHPQVVWTNDAGAGPWAGRIDGIDDVAEMFARFLTFFEGTFTQELLDVCASAENRTVMVLREMGVKDGHRFEQLTPRYGFTATPATASSRSPPSTSTGTRPSASGRPWGPLGDDGRRGENERGPAVGHRHLPAHRRRGLDRACGSATRRRWPAASPATTS